MNQDTSATPPARPAGEACFATTRWTVVLRARGEDPQARDALADLCEVYWNPVFRFLCRQGRPEDTARELTQEFFARLLRRGSLPGLDPNRGRFRSFLLGAVKHFLADRRDHERRLKRGGGLVPESLDAPISAASDTAPGFEAPDPRTAPDDAVFDRDWALALMARALQTLEAEFAQAGRTTQFERLKPWLMGDVPSLRQAEAGRDLGLSEGAVKVAIHRLRQRFRELIRQEIAGTLPEGGNSDEELRYLVEVLSRD